MPLTVNQIQNAYVAFFNRPADTAGLTYWSSYAGSSSDLLSDFAKQPEYTSLFTGLNNTQAVNLIYNNLFGRDADLTGLTYWVGQLTSGKVSIANIADAVNKGALGTDATIVASKTTAATTFTTNLDTTAEVIAYSAVSSTGLAAVKTWLSAVKDATTLATAQSTVASIITTMATAATATTTAGSTFTLTTGTNSFTGTSGADTFDGGISSSSLQTLNSGDSLDGGAGTDDLYAVITGSVTPAALKNIENVYVTNTTTGSTIDFSNATGLSAVSNSASTVALTMSGIASTNGPTVTVRDTAIAGQVVTFNDVTGSADADTIIIQNLSSGATLSVAGVETLTLQSDGSATNVLGSSTVVGLIAGAATRLNVTGSQGLTMATSSTTATATTNILPTTIVYLDASGNSNTTTGVTATMGSTTASTIVGSAGNDSFSTFSTGNDSVTMGAGNDTIWYSSSATWTVNDTVDGGAGTDTIRTVANSVAGIATPTTYYTTNIETIQISDALAAVTYTPANISSTATTLNVTGNTNATGNVITTAAALSVGNPTIVGPAGAFKLGLGASVSANTLGILAIGATTTITDTGTLTTDSITITNNAMVTSGSMLNVFNSQVLTITGYETVTINTGASSGVQQILAAITVTGDSSANTTLNFTGVNAVQLTAATTATTIDASGITASGTGITSTTAAFFMNAGSTTGGTTVTGSGGIDVLIGNTSSASSITAGAGADTITGGSGNDTILGGTGNDSITSGAGNDSILGGDGDDQITMGANLATGDVIDGGAGTDTLLSSAAIAAAAAASVTNIEVISFSATTTQDMTAFLNSGITTVGATAGAVTVSNAQTALTSLILGASGATAVTGANVTRLVDGTADALSILLLDGTTGTTTLVGPSLTHEETLTIGESGTDSTAAVTFALGTVTATSLTTLNVSGSNTHTMTLSGETALKTVSASSATGTLNIAGGNSAVNMTVTGPTSAAMSIVAGSGNDSITAGAAADSITGGSGADTILRNAGNDTIIGGIGADSLVGGEGTDTISVAYTLATDGGSVAATGVVVNLSASAVLATTIAGYKSTGVVGVVLGVSSDISSVAAGTSVNVGLSTNVATTSSRVDTLSGFEAIQGSTGTDYLVGNTSANTITGGTGADVMVGGSGADTFSRATADGVAVSTATYAGNIVAAGDTLLFINGADVITDFTSGTDFIDGAGTDGGAVTSLIGYTTATNLVANTQYYLSGTYTASTGSFAILANGGGADTLFIDSGAVAQTIAASTNITILVGVLSTTLVTNIAADFI